MSRLIAISTYSTADGDQWQTITSSALPDGDSGLPERRADRVSVTVPAGHFAAARAAIPDWCTGVPLRLASPDPTVIEAWIDGEPWWWFVDPEPVSAGVEYRDDPTRGQVRVTRQYWGEITR